MKCPSCGHASTRVVDSDEAGDIVHRSRECTECGSAFATSEQVRAALVMVVKNDGRREEFQREKLLRGLHLCTHKRPLPAPSVHVVAADIERRLGTSGRDEVPSRVIGEMVMSHLKRLDLISYIRFAAGYRQFVSADDLLDELNRMIAHPLPPPEQPRLFDDDLDYLLAGIGEERAGAPTPIGLARSARN